MVLLLPLLLSLAAPAPSAAAPTAPRSDDPPVKVWLDQGNYRRADKAHVNIKLGEDGYLVVLRADANGRVRVLFPLDPADDAFVRGGRTIEVRGRGDREAFSIDEGEGSGLVLAARSVTPFKLDEFARGDHWDYRMLTARDAGDDKERALLDIVQRMVPDGPFDYDAVNYTVASPQAYHDGAYFPYSSSVGLGLGYGFGWPRGFSFSLAFGDPFFFRPFISRASCFDPFFFDPFFCNPFFLDPFFFHRRFFFPRVLVFSRTVIVFRGGTGVVVGFPVRRGLLIDRARPEFRGRFIFRDPTPITATGPRLRVPTGVLRSRPAPANAAGRPRESMDRKAATPIRDRRPSLEQRVPAPRTENRPRGTARAAPAPIWDRRLTTLERRMPGPAARAPDGVEVPSAGRAPEQLHEPSVSGSGRAPALRYRRFSVGGVSGRTFALPPRPAGSVRRGGGGRRQ
ncbi:MAG TPA: DUF4384 domain-containing protein [Gemmatimonadales bacterium]|nr:DUF4384 domain-containing protein [Gemmatimonadales bacterium]